MRAGPRTPALLPQEIEHRRLRQHRFGNAVALGASTLLGGLGCLQISAEMARTLDDALPDREPRRLEASYRGSGLGGAQLLRTGGFPGVVTGTLNSGFGGVLGQTFGPDYPTWSVGVTVSHTIGSSYERVRQVQAEVERRQAAARVASVQLDVAASLRQSSRQVRSAAEREDAARAGATLAQQRLDAEQRRYGVGLSTSFLVIQAQRDLSQARTNELSSVLAYDLALVAFETSQQAGPEVQTSAASVATAAATSREQQPNGIERSCVPSQATAVSCSPAFRSRPEVFRAVCGCQLRAPIHFPCCGT